MIDCPCGFGKNIPEEQKTCPCCGIDLTLLHRLKGLPRTYYDEGTRLSEIGNIDLAIEKLITAISLDHHFMAPYLALGNIYMLKGLNLKALDQYDRGLKIDPGNEEMKKAKMNVEKASSQLTRVKILGRKIKKNYIQK